MLRVANAPRANYRDLLRYEAGLVYADTVVGVNPDGSPNIVPYWIEDEHIELSLAQAAHLETAANTVFMAMVDTINRIMAHRKRDKYLARMGIPAWRIPAILQSWEMEKPNEAPSIYARFDMWYDGVNPARALELNPDTPTSLLEAGLAQWLWFLAQNLGDGFTQWNDIHTSLVAMWEYLQKQFIDFYGELPTLHYACTNSDLSYEDRMTVEYIADTARQAGWTTSFLTLQQIRYDRPKRGPGGELLNPKTERRFFDQYGKRIRACFKLCPWEMMGRDKFGRACFKNMMLGPSYRTTWIEPPHKEVLGSKGLWPFVWYYYQNDSVVSPHLLAAFGADDPKARQLDDYASKPIDGREGSGVRLVRKGKVWEQIEGPYSGHRRIHQELCALSQIGGYYTQAGVWMGGTPEGTVATGVGFRAGKSPIMNNLAGFLSHVIRK